MRHFRATLLTPCILILAAETASWAATFNVTSTSDDGPGSLRQAIVAANNSPGTDALVFTINGVATIASNLPAISENVNLIGPGTNQLTLSGGNFSSLLSFAAGTTNSVSGLTLANAYSTNAGAAIRNFGHTVLTSCALVSNRVVGAFGGAVWIAPGAGLAATNCSFNANQAFGGHGVSSPVGSNGGPGGGGAGMGGAIFTEGSVVTLSGCDLSANTAAGGNGGSGNQSGVSSHPGGGGGSPNAGAGGVLGADGTPGGFGGGGGGGAGSLSAGFNGGAGGFGGGGGGGGARSSGGGGGLGGAAGNFGGNGGGASGGVSGGGGGGAGLGGALFIRTGGVTIVNCNFVGNLATNGIGAGIGVNGQGVAGAVFVHSDAAVPYFVAPTGGSNTASTAEDNLYTPFVVTTLADSGPGSLRSVVAISGLRSGPNTITFATNGVIVLASDLPEFNESVNLHGPGTNLLTISGGNSFALLSFRNHRTNRVSGLTLAHAFSTNGGAAIRNLGVTTIENCLLASNRVVGHFGGAVYNGPFATLMATNCRFVGNAVAGGAGSHAASGATGGPGGGGAGLGGAVFTEGAVLTLNQCQFYNNAARGGPGGDGKKTGPNAGPGQNGGGPNPGSGGAMGSNGGPGGFGGGGGGGAGSLSAGFNGGAGGLGGGGGGGGARSAGDSGGLGGAGGNYGGNGGPGVKAVSGGGGGGAGLGGALFARNGNVAVVNTSFTGNLAASGAGGQGGDPLGFGQAGQGVGGGVFSLEASLAMNNSTFSNNAASTTQPDLEIAPLLVTTTFDNGPGSLRQAVLDAAVLPGTNRIHLASSLSGQTITLFNGQIEIFSDVIIDASSLPEEITLSGNFSSRVFRIGSGASVALIGLIIRDGRAAIDTRDGGGISSRGHLAVTRCSIIGNQAFDGGGICSFGGSLILNQSTVANNTATNVGGGICIGNGTTLLQSSSILSNTATASKGGGIYAQNQTVVVEQCTVAGNLAVEGDGGGIYQKDSTLTLNHCTVISNAAALFSGGGGVFKFAPADHLTLHNSIVANNVASSGANLFGTVNTWRGENLVDVDPLLAPLGDYGGPTRTAPPLPASPAFNGAGATTLATDQRGLPRPRGAAADIGAVEVQYEILVENTADSGKGSLREALAAAPEGTGIAFASNLSGQTITLTSGQLVLDKSLAIDAGRLSGGITISGNSNSRVLLVGSNAAASLHHVTITAGRTVSGANGSDGSPPTAGSPAEPGGGILNHGTLLVRNANVLTNRTGSGGNGGSQHAPVGNGGVGGAGGAGAGIYNSGALVLENSTISGNVTGNGGAGGSDGFYQGTYAPAGVDGSGGGLYNAGSLTLRNTTIAGNVVGNRASGGGFYNVGTVAVAHATIAGNVAGTGGGLANAAGIVSLVNTILGANMANTDSNLSGFLSNNVGFNLVDVNPLLRPLGFYGGGTPTMPPLPGSPALNAGSPGLATTDQRGLPRPMGGAPEIGAVEFQSPIIVTTNQDSGPGSLRHALAQVDDGGVVAFASPLSGQTITLASGALVLDKSVTLDGSGLPVAPILSGGLNNRLFQISTSSRSVLNQLTLSAGAATDDYGGAILNFGDLTLNGVAIHSNSADYGGGLFNYGGVLRLNNCTLTDNIATTDGGGLFNFLGDLVANNCTIAGNSAAAFAGGAANDSGNFAATNCILAGNTASLAPNLFGPFAGANNLTLLNPRLGPLGYYGGPTPFLPLLAGSPAVDTGLDAVLDFLAADQRGAARKFGAHVDLGAFELALPEHATRLDGPGPTLEGRFQFFFTNTPGVLFGVLTTTNLALPVGSWTLLEGIRETPPGHYQFTDSQSDPAPQRFYLLRAP